MYNGFAEIQTLTDGFSKPICFYHLPLVKRIKYSPNKSRGPRCHWSFCSGLQWVGSGASGIKRHTWRCMTGPFCDLMLQGTAGPEPLTLRSTKKYAKRTRSHHGPPSLSMEEKSCALFKWVNARKGVTLLFLGGYSRKTEKNYRSEGQNKHCQNNRNQPWLCAWQT